MRSAGLILLAALVAFVPALQAEACRCGTDVAETAATACCCGGDAACACPGCGGQEDPSPSLGGCVCTKDQPQAKPAAADQPILAEAVTSALLPAASLSTSFRTVCAARAGDLRPPSFRPLLV